MLRTITVLIVMMNITRAHAADWKQWESLRWSGLESYRKGDLPAAKQSLEAALQEAMKQEPGHRNEVVSTLDLCRVALAAGDAAQAESYGRKALEMGRKSLGAKSAVLTQALLSMVELESGRNRPEEVEKLDAELDSRADEAPEAGTIGTASIAEDGTISLQLRAESADSIGDALATYPVDDPRHRAIRMHLGPIRPGEVRMVSPWD